VVGTGLLDVESRRTNPSEKYSRRSSDAGESLKSESDLGVLRSLGLSPRSSW